MYFSHSRHVSSAGVPPRLGGVTLLTHLNAQPDHGAQAERILVRRLRTCFIAQRRSVKVRPVPPMFDNGQQIRMIPWPQSLAVAVLARLGKKHVVLPCYCVPHEHSQGTSMSKP